MNALRRAWRRLRGDHWQDADIAYTQQLLDNLLREATADPSPWEDADHFTYNLDDLTSTEASGTATFTADTSAFGLGTETETFHLIGPASGYNADSHHSNACHPDCPFWPQPEAPESGAPPHDIIQALDAFRQHLDELRAALEDLPEAIAPAIEDLLNPTSEGSGLPDSKPPYGPDEGPESDPPPPGPCGEVEPHGLSQRLRACQLPKGHYGCCDPYPEDPWADEGHGYAI